ncbi:ribbon-helix-helix protein, copG family [bacterium BMS3Bbin09]|nr:ribbon-helix-helix protein, copG family [bacterium BMS3Bbin09]
MSTSVSIRIPDEIAKQIDEIAKETERSKSFIIQKAIESYIDDFSDLQIALDRLNNPKDEIISSKELKKSLGI